MFAHSVCMNCMNSALIDTWLNDVQNVEVRVLIHVKMVKLKKRSCERLGPVIFAEYLGFQSYVYAALEFGNVKWIDYHMEQRGGGNSWCQEAEFHEKVQKRMSVPGVKLCQEAQFQEKVQKRMSVPGVKREVCGFNFFCPSGFWQRRPDLDEPKLLQVRIDKQHISGTQLGLTGMANVNHKKHKE